MQCGHVFNSILQKRRQPQGGLVNDAPPLATGARLTAPAAGRMAAPFIELFKEAPGPVAIKGLGSALVEGVSVSAKGPGIRSYRNQGLTVHPSVWQQRHIRPPGNAYPNISSAIA